MFYVLELSYLVMLQEDYISLPNATHATQTHSNKTQVF